MKSKKIEYIDLANVIATFAVVFYMLIAVSGILVKKDIGLLQMLLKVFLFLRFLCSL